MSEKGSAFREMREAYNEAVEVIGYELESMSEDDNCGGVSDDEIENAVAEENHRIVSAVMKTAVQTVGKYINDTVEAYDGGDEFNGADDFHKGDRLVVSSGKKNFYSIYIGYRLRKGHLLLERVRDLPRSQACADRIFCEERSGTGRDERSRVFTRDSCSACNVAAW